tara:strand:+ start:154 stop:924 length:771 start_codon:yes stop_codon:yes gene_type:complete
MKTNNTPEIKVGIFDSNYPIKKVKIAGVNRETVEKHSENFKSKLIDFGWMMPIVISNSGDLIEGHHRLRSAMLLNQTTVPAYIVNWIDTNVSKKHLDTIISLNNGNKAWTTLDYLKAYIPFNEDYKTIYNIFSENTNNITVGNVVMCYFNTTNYLFKDGKAKIKNKDFSDYLLSKFSYLTKEYGKNKIAAYCIRELITVAFFKTKMDKNAMNYLFKQYEKMAKENHLAISSISDFRPIIETYLNEYYMILKHKGKK